MMHEIYVRPCAPATAAVFSAVRAAAEAAADHLDAVAASRSAWSGLSSFLTGTVGPPRSERRKKRKKRGGSKRGDSDDEEKEGGNNGSSGDDDDDEDEDEEEEEIAAETSGLSSRSDGAVGSRYSLARAADAAARPRAPATGSECPSRDLDADSASGRGRRRRRRERSACFSFFSRRTLVAAPTSIGSPSAVPVPCISSKAIDSAETDAEAEEAAAAACSSAEESTDACAGPEGAVSDAERPSWLTAEPARTTTASFGDGDEEEEDEEDEALSFSSSFDDDAAPPTSPNITHASARTYPSALASSALHRPSAESMPAACVAAVVAGDSARLTPPASADRERGAGETAAAAAAAAAAVSLACLAARWTATSADEHAVSTAAAGPRSANRNATRPAATENADPVAEYGLGAAAAAVEEEEEEEEMDEEDAV